MKKYRLIERLSDGSLNKVNVYENEQAALYAMNMSAEIHKDSYFRIEEVEESITERVKSYEDACEVLGIDKFNRIGEHTISLFNDLRVLNGKVDHIIAFLKLETITAALNEGWKPDLEDRKQGKWYVFYDGNVLSCNCVTTPSHTLTHLYFKSRKLAEYAAKHFADLYKQLLIEKF